MTETAAVTGGRRYVTTVAAATGEGGTRTSTAAADGAQSLPAAPHGSAEVLGHQRIDERVDARMDVRQQVDDNAEGVHLAGVVIQSDFNTDFHREPRAPADEE